MTTIKRPVEIESPRRPATLPNCDRCGRFTSHPVVTTWCDGTWDSHTCYERLLCPTCTTEEAQ